MTTGLAFRAVSPRLRTARLVGALAAMGVLLLFVRLVSEFRGPGTAFFATAILVSNAVFFGVARTALPAMFSLFWMLVALRLWSWSEHRRWLAAFAGAAFVWAGLFEDGPRNAFFLVVGLFLVLFVRLHAWKMPWLPAVRRRLALYWFGFGGMLLVFFISLFTRWREYGTTWGHLTLGGVDRVPANVLVAPVYLGHLFKLMPITAIFVAVYFLFFARDLIRPVARHRRLDEIGLGFLAWLLLGGATFVLLAARSLDSLVLLLPPAAVVAADGLRGLASLRRISRPRIDIMIVMTAIAALVWFTLAWLVHRHYTMLPLPESWREHQIRGSYVLIAVGWLVGTTVLGWLYLRWKALVVRLHPAAVTAAAVALGLGMPLHGIQQSVRWWHGRTHEVFLAARALDETLPPGSLVVGSWAPLLTLGGGASATVIMRNVNDNPELWHQRVSHLLLDSRTESGPDSPAVVLIRGLGRRMLPVEGAALEVNDRRLDLYRVETPPALP